MYNTGPFESDDPNIYWAKVLERVINRCFLIPRYVLQNGLFKQWTALNN